MPDQDTEKASTNFGGEREARVYTTLVQLILKLREANITNGPDCLDPDVLPEEPILPEEAASWLELALFELRRIGTQSCEDTVKMLAKRHEAQLQAARALFSDIAEDISTKAAILESKFDEYATRLEAHRNFLHHNFQQWQNLVSVATMMLEVFASLCEECDSITESLQTKIQVADPDE